MQKPSPSRSLTTMHSTVTTKPTINEHENKTRYKLLNINYYLSLSVCLKDCNYFLQLIHNENIQVVDLLQSVLINLIYFISLIFFVSISLR